MTNDTGLYVPKGASSNAQYTVDIDPKRAGWTYCSLRIVTLVARTPSPPATASGSSFRWKADVPSEQKKTSSNSWAGKACSRRSPTSRTFPGTPRHRSPPAREAASPWQERSASDDSPPATAPRRRSPSKTAAAAAAPARCLQEIYYFEIDGPNVPDGWPGPSIAQPGQAMYYLNVDGRPG